jgi:hypothetical protein
VVQVCGPFLADVALTCQFGSVPVCWYRACSLSCFRPEEGSSASCSVEFALQDPGSRHSAPRVFSSVGDTRWVLWPQNRLQPTQPSVDKLIVGNGAQTS